MLNLLDESIFNNSFLIDKFESAIEGFKAPDHIEKILEDINVLCTTCREKGWRALNTVDIEIKNIFIVDFINLVSQANTQEELINIISLVKPRLYHHGFSGKDFAEAVLYYEALLLILSGETTDLIRLKLKSILNL